MKRCPYCNHENTSSDSYCDQCGSELATSVPDTVDHPPQQNQEVYGSPLSQSSESSPSPSSVESNPYFPIPSEDAPPQPSVYATYATTFAEVRQEETKRNAGDIMLSIALYLLGTIVAWFGFGEGVLYQAPISISNLTFFLGVLISIVILVLRKHKRPRYHAKQRLSILLPATVGGYYFWRLLGDLIGPTPPEVFGSILTVYGVVVAITALW